MGVGTLACTTPVLLCTPHLPRLLEPGPAGRKREPSSARVRDSGLSHGVQWQFIEWPVDVKPGLCSTKSCLRGINQSPEKVSFNLYDVWSTVIINLILIKIIIIALTYWTLTPSQEKCWACINASNPPIHPLGLLLVCFQWEYKFPHTLITYAVKLKFKGNSP